MKKILEWFIPVFTLSEANASEHWTKKKKRKDLQKKWIWIFFKKEKPIISLPCHIKLIRTSKRFLDSDNLPTSMKYIRDAIADQIFPGLSPGQADNDSRISWEYDQIKSQQLGIIIIFYYDDI